MKNVSRRWFLGFCAAVASGHCILRSAWGDETQAKDLTAKQILERVATTYAKCETYQDAGVVSTVFFRGRGERTERKPFMTAFVRPTRQLRYEFYDEEPDKALQRYIVWCKGDSVKTWWDLKRKVETPKSLGLGLAGATGVSSGSAWNVPHLLLPKELPGNIIQLNEPMRIDDSTFDGHDCFGVKGKRTQAETALWIDQKSFLLRRIDERTQFDDFRTEETTTYDPVINAKVAENLLAFDAPVAK